jgi:hypothetical protein
VITLVIVLVVVVGGLGLVFWNVLRVDSNSGPALGTNAPYPDTLLPGGDAPPYLPTPLISEDEEFRRDAGRRLAELERDRAPRPAHSWMDDPGAMEAAGLVDDPETTDAPAESEQGPDVNRDGRRA